MPRAVHLDNVSYAWPGQGAPAIALNELTVDPGEKLFVQGASGSGKSTLLSLLSGIITPDRGTVEVLGRSISAMSHSERDHFRAHHMGYLFQQFNLVPYLTVVENVTLPLRFSQLRRERAGGQRGQTEAARLLRQLGLDEQELHCRNVMQLSVGQQQRVAAARALIGRPEIVIADEPTSALDAENREQFMQLLFRECEQAGATLVFVSHDRTLGALFDRVIELEHAPNMHADPVGEAS